MDTLISESVQQRYRAAKCTDLYYANEETAQKQCFRTTQNTRYVQQFANLTGGSSVFTIPPNNGIQDIVLSFELPAQDSPSVVYNGSALPRGWGYGLIKQVSFRYGGSSQYFLSGQQVLQNTLRKTPNGTSRDDMLALGGEAVAAAAAGAGDFSVARRAYVWLPLPHTIPTAEGKLPPLPSDLLTQQIQITVELLPLSSIFSVAVGATPTLPSGLSSASFQVQQVLLENQGDALSARTSMADHYITYPIEFTQQEVVIGGLSNVSNSAQTVTLTGFRSGECKNIHVWLTRDADMSGVIKNPFAWYAPEDVVMTYAGEVFARFDKGSGALWNLVNGRIAPAANDVRVTDAGGGVCAVTSPALDAWLELPFAQTYDALTAHSMYTAGKPITNGIVNLQFSIPPSAPAGSYTLHVTYNYNALLSFGAGTCDYIV